ncbi:MAG TPA: SRPBCC family protein [Chryseosolibacter sp.]
METMTQSITVQALVNAPVQKVWNSWNAPEHITKWCYASDDWHAPKAENDIRTGGKFSTTMAAKDGSVSFDFGGVYSNVKPNALIEYAMEDGRKVKIVFEAQGDKTRVTETFDAEGQHPIEMQRAGWQAILDNFKKYTENLK